MNKRRNLSEISRINFESCSEFIFLEQTLIALLSISYVAIKQKLESEEDIIIFVYFIRNWFHKVLYDREEFVKIVFDEQKKNLYYNFYLNLLIKEECYLVHYTYSLDFIKGINIERKKTSQKFRLIMFSKIILDLIDNYRGMEEYNENEDSFELEEIEKENRQIIIRNIEVFKEIDLNWNENDILKRKIDEIYIKIINSLLRSKKVEDFDYACNVFEQLDLKNISLTNTIFDEFMNRQNYKDYEINNLSDLNDERKVNFYYLILKFIFKNYIYIYKVPFLLKVKKLFLELLKQKKIIYIKLNKKIEYIALKILDSKYFFQEFYKNIYEVLNVILKYYEEYFFETKIEDIKTIKDILKNKEVNYEKCEKYLKVYGKAKKINERIPIINYIYNLVNKENLIDKDNFIKTILKIDNFKKMIKERKIEKEYGEIMTYFIKDENNNKILSKILDKNEYNSFIIFINESINNIKNKKNITENLINEYENKNNENSKIVKDINNEEQKENNINYRSLETKKCTKQNSIIKKEKKLDDVESTINDEKINFTNDILKKCSIRFHTNVKGKEPYIIYDKILYRDYNIEIDYTELLRIKNDYEYSQQKNEFSENYLKLFYFLKEIEERIKNEFIFNYKLKIELDIRKEGYNNNRDSTYNISCLYTFYDPINNSIHKYEDKNILINGTNSLNQGFQFMLYKINSECYKDLKYKKYDKTYSEPTSIFPEHSQRDLLRTKDKESLINHINMIKKNIIDNQKTNYIEESKNNKYPIIYVEIDYSNDIMEILIYLLLQI